MSEVRADDTEVLERIDDAFFALDDDWRFTYLNDRAAELIDVDREAVIGERVWDEFPEAVDTTFQEQYERAMEAQDPVAFEEYYPPLERWFEVNAYPGSDGLSVYFRDVTDRFERERELERYEAIVETARDGIYTVDEDGHFTMVNEAYAEMTGYDQEELVGSHVSAVVDRSVVNAAAALEDKLEAGTEETATMSATIERKDGSTFEAEATFSMTPTGERVGVVRDVSARKEREAELSRTRDLLEQAERIADVGGWEVDPEAGSVFWTDHLFDILEVEFDEEPSLEGALDVYQEDDRQYVEDAIEESIESREPFDIEARFETPSGEVRWLRVQGEPTVEGGEVTTLRGSVQDVTERKAREREITQARDRVQALFDNSPDLIDVLDLDGRILEVNQRFCDVLGYEEDELLGRHIWEIDPTVDEDHVRTMFAEMDEGDTRRFEAAYERRDGTRFPVEVNLSRVTVAGEPRILAVVRDISAQKQRERQLEQYESIVETVEDGVYALDSDDQFLLVNDAFCEMTGYDRSELLGEHVTRVKAEWVVETANRLAAEVASGDRDEGSIEFEIQPKEGDPIPVESRLKPFPLGEGTGRCGVVRDVSERRERENELRRRVEQQAIVTRLGKRALEDRSVDELMSEASRLVAEALETDYCKILDLDADGEELLLRQGVGWRDGIVGSESISAVADDSQAAYTLSTNEPVVVEALDSETRFSGPDLLTSHDVKSGISTIIGPADDPWGILGTHDRDERSFTEQDVNFVQSVANVLGSAVGRHRDEQELAERHERLAALNDINSLVHDLSESLFALSTESEIEDLVCDRLASSDSYEFAWIGQVADEEVVASTEAGVEGYLSDITLSLADGREGPTVQAHDTGEMQVVRNVQQDPRYEPWRDRASEYGYRASASIPIIDGGEHYGTLNVYSSRDRAFSEEERDALRRLGSITAYAIRAIERDRELQRERDRVEFMNRLLRHNLLNSLNVVEARLDLLDGRVDYEVSAHLETAIERTKEMTDFVETVREVTKVIGHGDEQELESVALGETLVARVDRARNTYPEAEFNLERVPTVDVVADDLLGEVLDNVLVNAVHHNDTDSPTVWIETSITDDEVAVAVADDGPGIPYERQAEIFEREAKDFENPGSGFGLYLVDEIVNSYDGSIDVTDSDAGGARFELTFKRA